MFSRWIGTAVEVILLMDLDIARDLDEFPDIGYLTGNGGNGRSERTGQQGAGVRPLTTFEIAIGCRDTIFTGRDLVLVHTQTCRAAGLPEKKSRFLEHLIDPFFDGLLFDLFAAR